MAIEMNAYNKNLAPVVMTGYSRAWTLERSLKNLSNNYALDNRDIWLYLDAPYREIDVVKCENIYRTAVEAKNNLLPNLHIVRRPKNFGVPDNIIAAIQENMDRYGRIIFFEDDVLVSKTFLGYMDAALSFYQDDPRIFCINGHVQNVKIPRSYGKDVFLTPRNSAWGWAGWKDRWDKVDLQIQDWPNLKADKLFVAKLRAAGCDLFRMAEGVYSGEIKTWDLQCTIHIVKNNMLCVAPCHNMTRNIGFADGEGVNCQGTGRCRDGYYNFQPKLERILTVSKGIAKQLPFIHYNDTLAYKIRRRLFPWYYAKQDLLDTPEYPLEIG